jgi:hypothetical protein
MYDAPRVYPLQWPTGYQRTPAAQRRSGLFKSGRKPITIRAATERLQIEIERLGGKLAVLSTNIEPRLDGLPRSDRRPLGDDPGVCVYFHLQGRPTAMPSDGFDTVEDNIAALAGHIEAVRKIERYRVGTVEQMFAGFQAIRGPGEKPWREVMGIRPDAVVTREDVRARRDELAKRHHPDVGGGSHDRMAEINTAVERAMAEFA